MTASLREAFRTADSLEPTVDALILPFIPRPRQSPEGTPKLTNAKILQEHLFGIIYAAERGEYSNLCDSEAFLTHYDPFATPHDADEEPFHPVHPYSDAQSLRRDFAADL